MKKLSFIGITLVSKIQRRAIRVVFDPKTTILTGTNDTGKSSIIKNLFWTFGAEPTTDARWREAKVISVVHFDIAGSEFHLLRRESFFALFDETFELIKTFTSVTNELGPFLAELLDFKVILSNRNKEGVIPPTAFYFLPYYMDQDTSWTSNWSSFTKLQQFPKFKNDLAEYHTGIRPNEYYVAKAILSKATDELSNLNAEQRILKGMAGRLNDELSEADFNIDIEIFKEEINDLISKCQRLQLQEQKLKDNLVDLNNDKLRIQHQISLVQSAMREARLDYKFASNLTDEIGCPICGAVYENDFATRFDIAMDEGRCAEMLVELESERLNVDLKFTMENDKHSNTLNEIQEIQAILDRRQGEILLRDVINSQGKNELKSIFKQSLDGVIRTQVEKQMEINTLNEKIKGLGDKKRRTTITEDYRANMRKYLHQLDVQLSEKAYSKISSNIKAQGSDMPRALLAYYYAILAVMRKYSSAVFAPMVIDSPNQQDQDKIRLDKLLNFIKTESPTDCQLILGVADLHGVEIPGTIMKFEHQYSLLREDQYDNLNSDVTLLLEKAYNDDANSGSLKLF
ncbi:hypothetical protein SAMN04488109_1768 [Chryseolinea serpens]|uniref:AAA domain-containing protein n=1 Tax=Chryseolinea serpens TaxID=947013 RepID=A0A1M5MIG8_9BACT|nr:hypothetical protein [Chryseolinea serpens]SHG77224.1 hypothetical protein SAMN04488109_1768 [Chryseolinea serpens]